MALERAAQLTAEPEARAGRMAAAGQSACQAGQMVRISGLLEEARLLTADPILSADVYQLRAWIELSIGSGMMARRLLIDAAKEIVNRIGRWPRRLRHAYRRHFRTSRVAPCWQKVRPHAVSSRKRSLCMRNPGCRSNAPAPSAYGEFLRRSRRRGRGAKVHKHAYGRLPPPQPVHKAWISSRTELARLPWN
jgi:hypothetical protein